MGDIFERSQTTPLTPVHVSKQVTGHLGLFLLHILCDACVVGDGWLIMCSLLFVPHRKHTSRLLQKGLETHHLTCLTWV